ncbi:MAG: UDP-2,4-diacetamido-2,4,6-trideoxy-beta-L-altropyranose hydrolase [Oscillospiraceae bacterium]|nr:UDP-2,4-diacetamido-2,4,6-trideoxy-beta-L-altropyranose hydrolase [Oscillospiraceae bacterium]
MGHVMRCLSIADAAKSFDRSITFLLADDTVLPLVHRRGYEAAVLGSDYQNMEDELDRWPQKMPDIVIVDSYYVTPSYLWELKKKTRGGKLVYIDGRLAFPYPVDIIVNYNAYGPEMNYSDLYASSKHKLPHLILGPAYAPLRPMFQGIPVRTQAETVQDVLISTGGADELHLTLSILKYLNGRKDAADGTVYHILLGAMNSDREKIRALKKTQQNVILHEDVTDMKTLMESMDLAVSAAGSTIYEICACGVPLITYSLADNQIPGAEAFERSGLAQNIGDLREPSSVISGAVVSGRLDRSAADRIFKAIDQLSRDYRRRCEIGTKMQSLIDGFGADRMVKEILRAGNPGK